MTAPSETTVNRPAPSIPPLTEGVYKRTVDKLKTEHPQLKELATKAVGYTFDHISQHGLPRNANDVKTLGRSVLERSGGKEGFFEAGLISARTLSEGLAKSDTKWAKAGQVSLAALDNYDKQRQAGKSATAAAPSADRQASSGPSL